MAKAAKKAAEITVPVIRMSLNELGGIYYWSWNNETNSYDRMTTKDALAAMISGKVLIMVEYSDFDEKRPANSIHYESELFKLHRV